MADHMSGKSARSTRLTRRPAGKESDESTARPSLAYKNGGRGDAEARGRWPASSGYRPHRAAKLVDAAAETAKREVLDFYEQIAKALDARDRNAMDPLFADDFVFTKTVFGRGEVLNKEQWLELRTSERRAALLIKRDHNVVNLRVFGNTVVMSGHSKTVLYYKGEISKGPRLFTFVFVKQDGRWQAVTWHMSDIPEGDEPWDTW